MTNYDKWLSYTEALPSPENYISWGWVYLISASLQRRVWCPPSSRPVFPNVYVTLVGKAGIGKGNVIRSVQKLLSHHKMETSKREFKALNADDQKLLDSIIILEQEAELKKQASDKSKGSSYKDKLLIPIGADAVTYEELVHQMASSISRTPFNWVNPATGKLEMNVASYCALAFVLEEMASLFRKNTESLVNFFLQAYDCGDSYEYATKNSGRDRITKLCLNILAGTTPEFMQETFDDRLISQGYSSRNFFIYAARNRKVEFFFDDLNKGQSQHERDLLLHIKKLTELYGECIVDDETRVFLKEWVVDFFKNPQNRPSKSPKLDAFCARINIHIMKVTMAFHFGESLDMHIPLSTFKRAIDFIMCEMKTMHLALVLTGTNPLSRVADHVKSFLAMCGKLSFIDIFMEVNSSATKDQLTEVLEMLQDTKQVIATQGRDEINDPILWYELKK